MRTRVILESPFAATDPIDYLVKFTYRQRCIADSIAHGESPFASHQMYTDALDDSDYDQRLKGIECGYAWWDAADVVVFYVDYGWSLGMTAAKIKANAQRKSTEERRIGR